MGEEEKSTSDHGHSVRGETIPYLMATGEHIHVTGKTKAQAGGVYARR